MRLFDPGHTFHDNSGVPLNAGTVTFYSNGTTTKRDTFSDESLGTANDNPMTLDAAGKFQTEVFGSGLYTILVQDVNGATITGSQDDVYGGVTTSVGTFTDGDTTPSVLGLSVAKTANSTAKTITALDDGFVNQSVLIIFNDSNTTVDFSGTTLKGNGLADRKFTTGESMRCTFDGTNWYCEMLESAAVSASATDQDATPSVLGIGVLTTANTVATTITTFDDGYTGQEFLLIIGDALTTIDFSGSTIKGNFGLDKLCESGDFYRCKFNGTNWYLTQEIVSGSFKIKTADQVGTATNTTLEDDTHLTGIPLAPSSYYAVEGYIEVNSASATPDYKFALTPDVAFTDSSWGFNATDDASAQTGDGGVTSTALPILLTTNQHFVFLRGFVQTAATTTTVKLQHAQNTSDAATVTTNKGSWLKFTRLA